MTRRVMQCPLGENTSRWEGCPRCTSEFFSRDIAAGLAKIEDEFLRKLFCYVRQPDSAYCTSRDIERKLLNLVLVQCKTRAVQALTAQLTHDIAELELTASRRHLQSLPSNLASYRNAMEAAKDQRWPYPSLVYLRVIRCVLSELGSAKTCIISRGAEYRPAQGHLEPCQMCQGNGSRPTSDLARARALGLTWHAYAKAWKAPFEWTFVHCEQALQSACDALCRNLCIVDEPHKTTEVLR